MDCDKAEECLRLTKGDATCPDQGKMCALYDEIGGGAVERALFFYGREYPVGAYLDWCNKGEVQK